MCVGLRSRSGSLIGVRETILESLARLAHGPEGRIEWPIAEGCSAGGARPGLPLPVQMRRFCSPCASAGAGIPDGSA